MDTYVGKHCFLINHIDTFPYVFLICFSVTQTSLSSGGRYSILRLSLQPTIWLLKLAEMLSELHNELPSWVGQWR